MGKKKKAKKRDPVAMDLLTNGLYRPKVEVDKKKQSKKDPVEWSYDNEY